MSFTLIHPSRSRPKKAYETYEKWVDNSGLDFIEYMIALDSDDPLLSEYKALFDKWDIFENDNVSVVQATNYAAQRSSGNWLVYLSDDFDCPKNWGKLLEIELHNVTRPTLLKVDDCLQPIHARVVTIPIMNRALYGKLGYFWNPLYKSMWVDCDLYETCDRIGAIRFAPHLKFPHNHHSLGKCENDETYKRSEANWKQGEEIFKIRKREAFKV